MTMDCDDVDVVVVVDDDDDDKMPNNKSKRAAWRSAGTLLSTGRLSCRFVQINNQPKTQR